MRRFVALLLALLLLTPLALAEEKFMLRGGLYWGMSEEEAVEFLRENEGLEQSSYRESDDEISIEYANVEISNMLMILSLSFTDDYGLHGLEYSVQLHSQSVIDFTQDLIQLYRQRYGLETHTLSGRNLEPVWVLDDTVIMFTRGTEWLMIGYYELSFFASELPLDDLSSVNPLKGI